MITLQTRILPEVLRPLETLRALGPQLATLGALTDAEPAYPREALTLLAGTGVVQRMRSLHGSPTAVDFLFDVLREVGRADLSLGRLFEGHANAILLFDWYGTPAQRDWLSAELAAGKIFGVWATEAPPGVLMIDQESGAWRLEGQKRFASGAGGIDHAVITAQPPHGPRRLVVVPADDAVRTDNSGWTVRGMRATTSGLYDLSGLVVDETALLGQPGDYDRDPRFTAGAWRFCAVQLGGVEGLLSEMRDAMPDAARADPLQRARFGEAVVATRTAFMWTREAAERAVGEHPDAPDFVRLTRGVVERAALDVMELAARAVGTRSAFDDQRIDKITRDLSLYLRQAGPDHARDLAATAWLDRDLWGGDEALW